MKLLNLIRYRLMFLLTSGKKKEYYKRKYKSCTYKNKVEYMMFQTVIQKLISLEETNLQRFESIEKVIQDIDFKQNLFLDYFVDPSKARPATGALAKRQAENFYLLKEFVKLCEKHQLDYWIDFGTLLGAKRHGGFVPWDDDIDVSMKGEDIKRFRDIFLKEHKKDLEFLFWEGKQSRLIFKKDTGAFLDIYGYSEQEDKVYPLPVFPINSYNSGIPKSILYPFSKIDFCGIKVNAPNNVSNYLRIKYGNYQVLPKKKHSVGGHNLLDEFWKE